MGTVWRWIVNNPDHALALAAIVISAVAMIDVRRLFKELERRDKNTENSVRQAVLQELLTHTASFATFSRAAQFLDFTQGKPDKQTSIAMLMSFRLQELLAPNASSEELGQLRATTRDKIEHESAEWAKKIISSGAGKLKDGWAIRERG